jgi:hypothetical protein
MDGDDQRLETRMDFDLPIERALRAVGELLAADGQEERIVVVGGAALVLLGVVQRGTRDVDVIALGRAHASAVELVAPEPIPAALLDAIARVARDLGLPPEWMNMMVASQWRTGLPPRFDEGMTWRRFGGLHVGLPSRFAFVCLKLYAAADQTGPGSRHFHDLSALAPTAAELEEARAWIGTQDPTIDHIVAKVVAHVRA